MLSTTRQKNIFLTSESAIRAARLCRHLPCVLIFFLIFDQIQNFFKTNMIITKNHSEKIKKPIDTNFNFFKGILISSLYVFVYLFIIFYIWSNAKLSFNWIDNNKKNYCENTKMPLDINFKFFIFKNILIILLCIWIINFIKRYNYPQQLILIFFRWRAKTVKSLF